MRATSSIDLEHHPAAQFARGGFGLFGGAHHTLGRARHAETAENGLGLRFIEAANGQVQFLQGVLADDRLGRRTLEAVDVQHARQRGRAAFRRSEGRHAALREQRADRPRFRASRTH